MIEQAMLEETYYHTCTIKRPSTTKDEDGFDSFREVKIHQNVKCAVSFAKGSTQNLEDTQAIEYLATLFISPQYEVLPGDIIYANVHGKKYEFRAGECARYPYHTEVPLLRKDKA